MVLQKIKKTLLYFLILQAGQVCAQPDFFARLADSAFTLTLRKVNYDPGYFVISYPGGDIPTGKGVCTDVIIRAYRKMGVDLQKEVHEDMKANFRCYPRIWGLTSTDRNIDHRRVPNLMRFFERHQADLPVTSLASDYQPGDVVCWDLGGGVTHIGILSDRKSADGKRLMVIHNIGNGQVLEDCLFKFRITGHYRYKK